MVIAWSTNWCIITKTILVCTSDKVDLFGWAASHILFAFFQLVVGSITLIVFNVSWWQGEDTQWINVDLDHVGPSEGDWVGVFSPAKFK